MSDEVLLRIARLEQMTSDLATYVIENLCRAEGYGDYSAARSAMERVRNTKREIEQPSPLTSADVHRWWAEKRGSAEVPAMTEWQPIETAPKDGTHVLGFWPGFGGLAPATIETWWGEGLDRAKGHTWQSTYEEGEGEYGPTHWMPLPVPPKPRGAR